MNVPDQLPTSTEDSTEAMRRQRVLKEIEKNVVAASLRVQSFMKDHNEADAIKKLHFADTDVQYGDDKTVRMRYFSLWDSMGMRLLTTGRLAKAAGAPNFEEMQANDGADVSEIVTIKDMEANPQRYNLARLGNLAFQLSTIAQSSENQE